LFTPLVIAGKAQPDEYSEVRRPIQNTLTTLRGKRRWERLLDRHQNLGKPSLISLFFPH